MKRLHYKLISILAITTLLCGMFCIGVSAAIYPIEDMHRYSATIAERGTSIDLSYKAAVTGRHFIRNASPVEIYVYLYDSSNRLIDSDTSGNFFLSTKLTKGQTYYYKLTMADPNATGDFLFDFQGPAVATEENYSYSFTTSDNSTVWYSIKPATTGCYAFESTAAQGECIYLYDDNLNIINSDNISGDNTCFFMPTILAAGKTYYYTINPTNPGETVSGTYEIYLYEPTIEPNYIYEEDLKADGAEMYRFTAPADGLYSVYTNERPGVRATLYNANGKKIASGVSDARVADYATSATLTAGKNYYLELRYENRLQHGTVEFIVAQEAYPDVTPTAWYYEAVSYVSYFEFMTGYKNGYFGPADNLQRQDFVVALARIAGADLAPYLESTGNLSDVKAGSYYAPSVAWAVDQGIIGGYQNGEFGVGDRITREQVCTILYRYVGSPAVENASAVLDAYPDDTHVSAFATTAMAWAIQNNVISGMQNGKLEPVSGASRAQIATILMRMHQNGLL